MKIKIIVAAHKPYPMPEEDIYLPLHVGRAGKEPLPYIGDDTGDNISEKNANYCELTGLYWAWKNLEADYIGLAHYRRHFIVPGKKGKGFARIAGRAELEPLLGKYGMVLPKKRNYFIETTYNQYVHAHHAADLDTTRAILDERYPQYLTAFDAVMSSTSGHRFNMFIMRRDLLGEYCAWLFDVLFELEKRLDISAYSPYDARVFGFVSERLLDVWVKTNGVAYGELPVLYMERQNWLVKGGRFVLRKLMGKRK